MRPATRKKALRALIRAGLLLLLTAPLVWGTRAQSQGPAPVDQVSKLTLEECVSLGLQSQPTIAAAQASLGAAQASLQAVERLCLARVLAKDLPIRREQGKLGVMIASAGLVKAEWDTRDAIRRSFFSVLYARAQGKILEDKKEGLIGKLDLYVQLGESKLKQPKAKIERIDVDKLKVQLIFYRAKTIEAKVGEKKARAALREAMGLGCDDVFDIAPRPFPEPDSAIDRQEIIELALSRRGEMAQAALAYQVTGLEIEAQKKKKGLQVKTFAAPGDVHAAPVPQGVSNKEYRPGAVGIEMPPYVVGHKPDRVKRVEQFNARAGAVVAKAQNLLTLEAEAFYYKWLEASQTIQIIKGNVELTKNVLQAAEQKFVTTGTGVDELLRAFGLWDQARAELNHAYFDHAVALAALERVTAGGLRPFDAGFPTAVEFLPAPRNPDQ